MAKGGSLFWQENLTDHRDALIDDFNRKVHTKMAGFLTFTGGGLSLAKSYKTRNTAIPLLVFRFEKAVYPKQDIEPFGLMGYGLVALSGLWVFCAVIPFFLVGSKTDQIKMTSIAQSARFLNQEVM